MKNRMTGTLRRKSKKKKKCKAAWKSVLLSLPMMLFAGFCVVLPLRAEEAAYAGSRSMIQRDESMSDNDTQPEQPQKDAENPDNGDVTGADAQQQDGLNQNNDNPSNSEPSGDTQTSSKSDNQKPADLEPPQNKKPDPPRITSEPEDVRVEAGDCAYFNVSAVGKNLTYQWYVNKGDGRDFRKIDGAREALYRVMVFDGSMNGFAYKCRVESKDESDAGSNTTGREKNGEDSGENCVESRAAKLTIFYRIVSGARSVWVKSGGRGLVFQGSGPYSRFSGISVDGSRIGADAYNKGGSQTPFTEITLLRSYLETLSEGDHEVEIVWSDGTAQTSFRIEAPASNLPAGASGLGRTGTDTEGSSRAAGKTSAAKDAAAGENKKVQEKAVGQISENTPDRSLSENTVKSPLDTVANLLPAAGDLADVTKEEMAVTPGIRRTQAHSAGFEKNPAQLAMMSVTVNHYATTICMAVILISAAGIVSGFLAYRLHDLEGRKR